MTTTSDMNALYAEEADFDSDYTCIPAATLDDIAVDWPCAAEDAATIYRQWGCVLVRGLLADVAEQIRLDGEAMAKAVRDAGYERRCNALVMPGDKTGRDKQIMLFCPSYPVAASHFRAAVDPRVADLLAAMVGPNVELYGQGMFMYKEPEGGMEKALHQDGPYFLHRDHSVCTGFVHAVATNETNGCLRVYPGSSKLGLLEHEDSFSHLALPKHKWPLDKALQIHAQPGDVVFFNYLTVHGSGNNNSDGPRPALAMQYRSADDRQVWRGSSSIDTLGLPLEGPDTHGGAMLSGIKLDA